MFARIIVESIAQAFATTLRAAAALADREIDVVHLVGGGALNTLLCQATADRSGVPCWRVPSRRRRWATCSCRRGRSAPSADASLADLRARVAAAFAPRRYEPRS